MMVSTCLNVGCPWLICTACKQASNTDSSTYDHWKADTVMNLENPCLNVWLRSSIIKNCLCHWLALLILDSASSFGCSTLKTVYLCNCNWLSTWVWLIHFGNAFCQTELLRYLDVDLGLIAPMTSTLVDCCSVCENWLALLSLLQHLPQLERCCYAGNLEQACKLMPLQWNTARPARQFLGRPRGLSGHIHT